MTREQVITRRSRQFPTFQRVLAQVNAAFPMCERTLREELKTLGISPVARRQRPNIYPPDTARLVLQARGITEANGL